MSNQATAIKNGQQLKRKIDYLQKVTTALLYEVKSISPFDPIEIEKGINLDEVLMNFEIQLIKRALEHTMGNQLRAANLLNVKYTTLCAKIKRYDIQT